MSWGFSSSLLVGLDWGEKEAVEVLDILLGGDCKHVAELLRFNDFLGLAFNLDSVGFEQEFFDHPFSFEWKSILRIFGGLGRIKPENCVLKWIQIDITIFVS